MSAGENAFSGTATFSLSAQEQVVLDQIREWSKSFAFDRTRPPVISDVLAAPAIRMPFYSFF